MIDPKKVLLEYLLTQTTLTDVVGQNIWAGSMPANTVPSTPMIIFTTAGGTGEDFVPMVKPSFDFRCYHEKDEVEANRAYRALRDVLHRAANVQTASGFMVEAMENFPGQDNFDPDTRWPFVFTTFRFIFHE